MSNTVRSHSDSTVSLWIIIKKQLYKCQDSSVNTRTLIALNFSLLKRKWIKHGGVLAAQWSVLEESHAEIKSISSLTALSLQRNTGRMVLTGPYSYKMTSPEQRIFQKNWTYVEVAHFYFIKMSISPVQISSIVC